MYEVSVVLTVYKRNHLEEQIQRINAQTGVNVKEIFVFQNESHVDVSDIVEKYGVKHIHNKNVNTKFHGRFCIPLWYESEYWAIFDDDTMSNTGWLNHAIGTSEKYDGAIVGANGRWANGRRGIGDGAVVQSDTDVDIVGHSWVFPRERIYTMFRDPPYTLDNAEDIHFCCAAKLYDGVKIIVPKQTPYDMSVWADVKPGLGTDEHATWKKPEHNGLRDGAYKYWMNKGWKPL